MKLNWGYAYASLTSGWQSASALVVRHIPVARETYLVAAVGVVSTADAGALKSSTRV